MSSSVKASPQIIIPPAETIAARQREEDERARLSAAQSITYDRKRDDFRLKMVSGIEVVIPRDCIDELQDASPDELARVAVSIGGEAIENDALDVHIAVSGLLRDVLGLNAGQRAGGRSRSAAKVAAAKENGRNGGRPRKHRA